MIKLEQIEKDLLNSGYKQIELDNKIRNVYQKGKKIVTVISGYNEIEWTFYGDEMKR